MTADVLSSLRFALRDGTRSAHERLDAMAAGFDLSLESDYGAFLSWHARLVPELENRLTANGVARLFPDWTERRRADRLTADLGHLGLEPPPAYVVAPGERDAHLVGAAYVLEGSRLGGAVLSKTVAPALRGVATGYLDHGTGLKLWPRFVDRLNRIELSGAETQAAISAANSVFAAFEHCLFQVKRDGGPSGP